MPNEAKDINKLMHQLQDKIADHMMDFFTMGREAKRLSIKNAPQIEIQTIHSQMADYLAEIKEAEAVVRQMYPEENMQKLFDELKKLRKKNEL